MLYLQPPPGAACDDPVRVPVAEAAALAFERALLARDDSERRQELLAALSADPRAASWAIAVAEARSGRTINRVDEAALWLAGHLVSELARALTSDAPPNTSNPIDWRLPRLVAAFFDAEQRMADFDRRLEHEKLESLKELAYGASHEINNPLANIAARAQTLLEDETDSERQRKLAAIHRQAMRAHEMIADLMLFARPPKLRLAPCHLQAVVETVVRESMPVAQEFDIELAADGDTDAIVAPADEIQLAVAIAALVRNALEAVSDGGHVRVSTRRANLGGDRWAEISIADDGPGISAEARRHMFDPFYSGREAGRGLGFGASKCWRIVTDHGGQVVVHSPATGGTEVSILLPLDQAAATTHRPS